jgi:hypothetical protein
MQSKCRVLLVDVRFDLLLQAAQDRFRGYVHCVMEAHFEAINLDSRTRSESESLQESLRGRLY